MLAPIHRLVRYRSDFRRARNDSKDKRLPGREQAVTHFNLDADAPVSESRVPLEQHLTTAHPHRPRIFRFRSQGDRPSERVVVRIHRCHRHDLRRFPPLHFLTPDGRKHRREVSHLHVKRPAVA